MKGLLLALVVVAALAAGADLVAVRVAEGVIAEQARSSGGLAQRPDVDVRGFPFLTQALAGRYDEVRVRAEGAVGGVQVEAADLRLLGVRLPLADALGGDVARVPVDALRGEVLLGFRELSARAREGVVVAAAEGERLRVRGAVRVLGRDVPVAVLSSVQLQGDEVVVRPEQLESGGAGLSLRVLGDRLDVRVPVDDLPYGLALTGLRVTDEGVLLTARSGPTVLQR